MGVAVRALAAEPSASSVRLTPLPTSLVACFASRTCLPAPLDGRGLLSAALLSDFRFCHKRWKWQRRGSPGSPLVAWRAHGGD